MGCEISSIRNPPLLIGSSSSLSKTEGPRETLKWRSSKLGSTCTPRRSTGKDEPRPMLRGWPFWSKLRSCWTKKRWVVGLKVWKRQNDGFMERICKTWRRVGVLMRKDCPMPCHTLCYQRISIIKKCSFLRCIVTLADTSYVISNLSIRITAQIISTFRKLWHLQYRQRLNWNFVWLLQEANRPCRLLPSVSMWDDKLRIYCVWMKILRVHALSIDWIHTLIIIIYCKQRS